MVIDDHKLNWYPFGVNHSLFFQTGFRFFRRNESSGGHTGVRCFNDRKKSTTPVAMRMTEIKRLKIIEILLI
jgi:hypothetical protein